MFRILRSNIVDVTGIILICLAIYLFSFGNGFGEGISINASPKILQMNTVFISILIEALPFVLIGVLIAGFIQIFVREEHIQKWIPKNKYLAVLMSCVIGALFPACECGIVPIVRRLIKKGVPLYAGIGFLLTGPLINPIVIYSTYMAFGNDLRMAILRMGLGFLISIMIALIISWLIKGNQLKVVDAITPHEHNQSHQPFIEKFWDMLKHSIDEFFDMGRYLIFGAFLAALLQTYGSTKALLEAGDGTVSSLLVMMGLAYFLSLCSEADAFIGASFNNLFPTTAILGFLIYGPMLDLKNTIMMLSVFKAKFVVVLLTVITSTVFVVMLISKMVLGL
ncbi:permease [Peribacillus alkalitolerans]|uniref:permease n=1 Tax=Peribacillus alkalitolerans TaxID=1550385 RepID=UPI0013D33021|nr:permease [Peribacillus alkalitolerans]